MEHATPTLTPETENPEMEQPIPQEQEEQGTPYVRSFSADVRTCWVCFATDDDDQAAKWTRPCRCRGTTQWVHQLCLQRWIDEKQRGNVKTPVNCPQCGTRYNIAFPDFGWFVSVLDQIDKVIYRLSPFGTAGIIGGSIYWTAFSYGKLTIMQVMGYEEGLDLMERSDTLFLVLGLPIIPAALILAKMIRWDNTVLHYLRQHCCQVPILSALFPDVRTLLRVPADTYQYSDPIIFSRLIFSSLMLPTLSVACGRWLFKTVPSHFQRAILGGVFYLSIKGTLKIYYKQQQFLRQAYRMIKDYEVEETVTVQSSK